MLNTFSITGASHYCMSFQPKSGDAERSLGEFRSLRLRNRKLIAEGTELFSRYRSCALRDVERSLFLSASHYRRGLDLMIPSSSHWAHVTLYYGTWFAAKALLGMFGCEVFGNHVVHVNQSSPNRQELRIQRIGNGQNHYYVAQKGSHQRFWEIFYKTVPSIRPFVDNKLKPALAPVSNSNLWLVEQRNKVNYDTVESMSTANAFGKSFSTDRFPDCLQGAINTQYQVCEGILAASCSFATQFNLSTDALDVLNPTATFSRRVRDLVYEPMIPDLVAKTKKVELFGS